VIPSLATAVAIAKLQNSDQIATQGSRPKSLSEQSQLEARPPTDVTLRYTIRLAKQFESLHPETGALSQETTTQEMTEEDEAHHALCL